MKKKTQASETSRLLQGRPKDAAKRNDIVRAATELFMKSGYELTSMEAVARKADVSKLTIYSHFADKSELFREVISTRCDRQAMPSSFMTMANQAPEIALIKIGEHMTALIFNSDSIRLHRIIQAEAARHPNLAKIFYEAGPKRVRTAFADLLRAWNKQGRLSVPNATKATEQFFSLLKGELLMKHIMLMEPLPGPQEIKKHVRATVRLFIAAHRAAPPSKIKSKKDMS